MRAGGRLETRRSPSVYRSRRRDLRIGRAPGYPSPEASNESPIQKNEEIKMENEVVASENEEEGEEEEEETEPILRRSHRQANPPKYLEDYVLMAEAGEEGEYLLMCLDNEPRDFSDASKSKEWIAACEDELR